MKSPAILFNGKIRWSGRKFGVAYNTLRPVLTNNLGIENPIQNGKSYHCVPDRKLGDPEIMGAPIYGIWGNKKYIRPGDILIPQDTASGQYPIITVSRNVDNQVIVGFRSEEIGTIAKTAAATGADILYENVRFSFMNDPSIGDTLNRTLGATDATYGRILMSNRAGIDKNLCITHLNDVSGRPIRWYVLSYVRHLNLLVLTVSREAR